MNKIILFFMALSFVAIMTSCGDDECATCTVVQLITANGEEIGRQELNTNQEFCGDELDAIRATEQTITQELGGITQEVATTVNCN